MTVWKGSRALSLTESCYTQSHTHHRRLHRICFRCKADRIVLFLDRTSGPCTACSPVGLALALEQTWNMEQPCCCACLCFLPGEKWHFDTVIWYANGSRGRRPANQTLTPALGSWSSPCYMSGSCLPAIDLEDDCMWSSETPGGTAGSQSIQLEACP